MPDDGIDQGKCFAVFCRHEVLAHVGNKNDGGSSGKSGYCRVYIVTSSTVHMYKRPTAAHMIVSSRLPFQ